MKTTDHSRAAAITGLAAVYGLAAKAGLALAVVNPSISAVWPPSAIGLGALLVLGPSCWPGLFAGAFLVNLHAALSRQEFGLAACVLSALGIAAGNTLEAAAGAWAVNRFAGGKAAVERAAGLLKLAIFAGALATMVSASVGVLTLWAAGMLPASAAGAAWLTWWLGDASGIIVGAPLILAWCAASPQKFKGGWAEAVALALFFASTLWLVFARSNHPIAYLVLPSAIWAAVRFGTRGSALAVVVLTGAALAGTLSGSGPFSVGRGGTDLLLLLQGFLATTALSSYAMASLVWERERAESDLRRSRDRLEAEVDRRTRELVQAQKMEAVGRLSGAVAHEFNNVLTGVVGLAELIRNDAAAGSQTAKDAGDIVTASRRGGALAKRLLSMTRHGAEKKPVSLNEAATATEKILRLAVGEKVELAFDLDPGAPVVLASADQLEQVLLNLCLNARDAMSGAGKLTVSTRVQRLPKALILSHGAVPPGDYAVLSVADTGAGIPEDIRSMIFEPFFSTKKSGQGTGLGLSIVYGIIADHKGAIDLVSQPGKTEFRLYLPVTKRAPAPTPVPAAAPAPARGTETILLADDDEAVRGIIARVLEPLGYRLLVAADGEEAWKLYTENAGKVAMAVLDVVMPRLKGDEVYARIAGKDPGFKVLFISGHATGQSEEAIRAGKHPFLAKPFSLDRIPALVREILDRRA